MAKDRKRLTKADTDAFFSKKQSEYAEKKKHKITAEELQQRADERAQQRAAKRPAGPRARAISIGLGVALLVGSGAVAVNMTSAQQSFESSVVSNAAKITELQEALAKQAIPDKASVDSFKEDLQKQIESATALGQSLAKDQQKFSEILFSGSKEDSGNGTVSKAFMESVEHRRDLAKYFVEDAFLVDDDEAYAPGSVLPFDADQIDPRFAWYVPSKMVDGKLVYSDPSTCTWGLVSVTPTTTDGVLDATWLCQDGEGDLYAWASASWYKDSEKFGSVVVGTTTIGDRGGE